MNNIGIIIQARMGSTRLPGKVLKLINGQPLLSHVLNRLYSLKNNAVIVIATSIESSDDVILDYCNMHNVSCFRGSETDVLSRYYDCARNNNFNHIVRLTADNPFTDIEELDHLIDVHLREKNDYTHSFGDLPIGVGAEIFTFKALENSHFEGHDENHREHVNEYIQERPNLFKIYQLDIPNEKKSPSLRLTVDTEDDYKQACFITEKAGNKFVETEEAIRICLRSV